MTVHILRERVLLAFTVPAKHARSRVAIVVRGNVLVLLASTSLAHEVKRTVRHHKRVPCS